MKPKIKVKHINNLIKNLEEVRTLLKIHVALTGKKRGNRSSVNVLNKSGIILIVACWEVFIEDVAKTAFVYMLNHAGTYDIFTKKVRTFASEDLINTQDKSAIWNLAGDGWKKILSNYSDKIINKYLGNFNTAKTEPIDELYENLIGLKSLSKYWHWKGMSNTSACSRLDNLATLRGDIAHRVKPDRPVLKVTVDESLDFIQNLAVITSNRVSLYVNYKTKSFPWGGVKYGNRR